MEKLKALLARCKCGVYLTVNEHRDAYQSVADRLEEFTAMQGGDLRLADDVRAKMIETDTIIHLQFYPDTPIGSYTILHYDLDAAFDQAMLVFGEE